MHSDSIFFSHCSLLDNNELLGGLSPEIYGLQMISESQVDEALLSHAAKKGSSCSRRFISWYVGCRVEINSFEVNMLSQIIVVHCSYTIEVFSV